MSALNLRTSSRTSILRIWSQVVSNAQEGEIAGHDDLLYTTKATFNKICIKLKRKMSQPAKVSNLVYSRASDMRLDPVSIPSFDGQPTNWLVFKDMFETLVQNRHGFDPTYKLGKLRQYLKAEKVLLIGGLYTGGHEEVWTELKRRYDNRRTLSETHVQRVLDLPNQPLESCSTLNNILDCVRNSFRALEVMDVPVRHWDAIAIPVILPRLPTVTRTEWGMSLKTNAIPKLEDLMSFIERRAANLPKCVTVSTQPTEGRGTPQSLKAHVSATSTKLVGSVASPGRCPSCSDVHRVIKCQIFRSMSVEIRWELARKAALCFNCLKAGNSTRECQSGMCANCQQKHNKLLCKKPQQEVSRPQTTTSTSAISPNSAAATSSTVAPRVLPRQQ
ncbi:uncharacterized protein LOC118744150 [Rhagoletis pomonella]|uniref:uncharacterized protein LOC118744150 n=1 Tax=Rhagoletis pomonella TaxID=28610 RepID=UPI00177D3F44|nr:uncharacterized protein LOC118744150 [Rhagoletis pomonella]